MQAIRFGKHGLQRSSLDCQAPWHPRPQAGQRRSTESLDTVVFSSRHIQRYRTHPGHYSTLAVAGGPSRTPRFIPQPWLRPCNRVVMADNVVHLACCDGRSAHRFVQCRSARECARGPHAGTLHSAEREGRSGLTCSTERTNPRQDSDGCLE